MEFREFKKLFQEHFAKMTKDATHLFEVEIDKDEFWNLYLDSFPDGTNNFYREKREFDCSCCRHFVKAVGNAVVIKDNKVETMWDFETGETTYQPVIDALSAYIKARVVTDVYVSKLSKLGTDKNREQRADGSIVTWEHFYLELPKKFVDNSTRSEGEIRGGLRDSRNVFKRSLNEVTMDALTTVLELISQNS